MVVSLQVAEQRCSENAIIEVTFISTVAPPASLDFVKHRSGRIEQQKRSDGRM